MGKKLTPEEKNQRAAERLERERRIESNAPYWGKPTNRRDPENSILGLKDSVWMMIGSGNSDIDIEVRRPGTVEVMQIDTFSISMTLETWAELADAAIRRVKWMRGLMAELDPAVQDALRGDVTL